MILVLGGTSEETQVAALLAEKGLAAVICRATDYSRAAGPPGMTVLTGRLDRAALAELVAARGIDLVIDATHPYAVEISRNAMTLPAAYIRFQRPAAPIPADPRVEIMGDYAALAQRVGSLKGKILWTAGIRHLDLLAGLARENIFVRCLPVADSRERCRAAGIPDANVITGYGPFSMADNERLYREYGIQILVTRESGDAGGFSEKVRPALALGLTVLVVARPRLAYPRCVSSATELAAAIDALTAAAAPAQSYGQANGGQR